MAGAQHRRRDPDHALAVAFFRNAEGFLSAAEIAKASFPEHALHFLAIAIELALKAYLLNRGVRDDWNRDHIGHDLSRALKCAQRAGFNAAPSDLAALAALLTPLYVRSVAWRAQPEVLTAKRLTDACDTTGDLLSAVDAAIGRRDGDTPRLIGMVTL
jgi:hypothetical protein